LKTPTTRWISVGPTPTPRPAPLLELLGTLEVT